MVGASNPLSSVSLDSQVIARIVGLTCVLGFIVDMTALTFPLGSGATWRVSLLQQMSDRSIVLFIGLALLLYSAWESKGIRKTVNYILIATGVLFLLLSGLVVRDSLILQSQAIDTIGQQVSQLQTQIEQSRNNPEVAANVTPEDFDEATRRVNSQAEDLKQSAKTRITKTWIVSASNFIVVGLGMLGLGKISNSPGGITSGNAVPSRKQRRKTS